MIENNLPNLLRKNKMNQSDLARVTGITNNTISSIYHQKGFPNAENMEKICLALDCTIGELFYIVNDEKKTLIDLKVS